MSKSYYNLYERVERMARHFNIPEDDFQDIVQLVMLDIFEKKLVFQPIAAKLLYLMIRNSFAIRILLRRSLCAYNK